MGRSGTLSTSERVGNSATSSRATSSRAGGERSAAIYQIREASIGETKAAIEKAQLQSLVHVLPDFVGQLLATDTGQTLRLMAYAPKVSLRLRLHLLIHSLGGRMGGGAGWRGVGRARMGWGGFGWAGMGRVMVARESGWSGTAWGGGWCGGGLRRGGVQG